jgi:Uncharacterised protein family (UPF0160)
VSSVIQEFDYVSWILLVFQTFSSTIGNCLGSQCLPLVFHVYSYVHVRLFSGNKKLSPVVIYRTMCDEIPTKCAKKNVKIGTHSGTFHCDELLACFMLTRLPEYKDAEIIRLTGYIYSFYF